MSHHHIHWSGKDSLDWESFGSRTDAETRAGQLMRPGETYTIEERDESCPLCRTRVKSTTAYETQEAYLNPKVSYSSVRYAWQQAVLEAFTEIRAELLPTRIDAARRAISTRLNDPTPASADEQTAIQNALHSLRILFPERSEPRSESGRKEEIA
jgi:hypothetical protein